MPKNEHLVLCGGAGSPPSAAGKALRLYLHGPDRNVRLEIADISRKLVANIPDVLSDLLEVACYVYAADSAIRRGGKSDAQMGSRWRRNFRFAIPVRRPDLWSSGPTMAALVETLTFLSDDSYAFEFRSLDDIPSADEYFSFEDTTEAAFTPDEVILFSGGLDSLAGAIEELSTEGRKVALVSHRSSTKITSVQEHLVEELRRQFGANRLLHVPVWATLTSGHNTEATPRSRSFLFAALRAVTARLFGLDRIRFFENGIVSLNLPVAGQVVGARATRTTHPQALAGFGCLFSRLLDCDFGVDNPFAWQTKADVVEGIAANGCSRLIRDTRSCTRVHDMTKLHTHCGKCSQCIDRRFGVLAAGQENQDPGEAYKVDLFAGGRPPGPDREMALAYVRMATEIKRLDEVAYFSRYGEVSRIVGFFDERADVIGRRVLELHRRHAAGVCQVFDAAVKARASAFREGTLAPDCLLSLIAGRQGESGALPLPITDAEISSGPEVEIRIGIDEQEGHVILDGWGKLEGVSAELIIALAAPYIEALHRGLLPQNYPFTLSGELRRLTDCDDEETFRKRVMRCRKKIESLAKGAGAASPSLDAVIENQQWRGYRLNPDRVRIVALSELQK